MILFEYELSFSTRSQFLGWPERVDFPKEGQYTPSHLWNKVHVEDSIEIF
jgi:hypothetical protein